MVFQAVSEIAVAELNILTVVYLGRRWVIALFRNIFNNIVSLHGKLIMLYYAQTHWAPVLPYLVTRHATLNITIKIITIPNLLLDDNILFTVLTCYRLNITNA